MAKSSTDQFNESLLVHSVNMERVKAGQEKEVKKLLEDLSFDVQAQLLKLGTENLSKDKRYERLKKVNAQIDQYFIDYYGDIETYMQSQDIQTARLERDVFVNSMNAAMGIDIASPVMDNNKIRRLAQAVKIDAKPAKKWWSKQSSQSKKAAKDVIRQGIGQGQTIDEMTKELRRKGGWEDKTKQQAEALVRTETQQILQDARMEMYKGNQDLIEAVYHSSTLDRRTTIICVSRDGLQWTIPDFKPIGHDIAYIQPPLHFQCRSTIMTVLKTYDELLGGNKPVFSEKQFEAGFRERNKPRPGESDLEYEERVTRQVAIQKKRMNRTPENTTKDMEKFIKADKGRAEEMLGKARTQMYYEGKMTLQQLIDQKGRPLTVRQLEKTYGLPKGEDKINNQGGKILKVDMAEPEKPKF